MRLVGSARLVIPSIRSVRKMRHLLETQNQIALNALRFVAKRLHDLQRLHRQAMTERVERRVARALLPLVHDAGRRVDEGVEIDFPI